MHVTHLLLPRLWLIIVQSFTEYYYTVYTKYRELYSACTLSLYCDPVESLILPLISRVS